MSIGNVELFWRGWKPFALRVFAARFDGERHIVAIFAPFGLGFPWKQ